jgi:hypothetical protein
LNTPDQLLSRRASRHNDEAITRGERRASGREVHERIPEGGEIQGAEKTRLPGRDRDQCSMPNAQCSMLKSITIHTSQNPQVANVNW